MDRLEDAKLVEGSWEVQNSGDKGPRRRYYHLTGTGVEIATVLLSEHHRSHPLAQAKLAKPTLADGWSAI
jgi:DNA-binding PadR family transcriptional regulator